MSVRPTSLEHLVPKWVVELDQEANLTLNQLVWMSNWLVYGTSDGSMEGIKYQGKKEPYPFSQTLKRIYIKTPFYFPHTSLIEHL